MVTTKPNVTKHFRIWMNKEFPEGTSSLVFKLMKESEERRGSLSLFRTMSRGVRADPRAAKTKVAAALV